jgi:16S rRNA processing protein RimM
VLVVVGRIGRAHGIRGAASIEVRTDGPDRRFAVGSQLLTDSGLELTITSATWHSGRLLLTFEGYDDRTAVEQLRNQMVSVDRPDDERPDDPEEFYDSDLEGCEVVDESGTSIGVVAEVSHLPAQDLLVVRTPEDKEILIPFVAAFVPTIDVTAKRLVVTPPNGLLDDLTDDEVDENALDRDS